MRKILSIILSVILAFSSVGCFAFAAEDENSFDFSIKTENIRVRDPSVMAYDGLYYMYGTCLATVAGYGCYVSKDLENWAGPYNVFVASEAEGFDGVGDYWAPECHYYQGSFYLFATYKSGTTGYRGTSVFKSESPLGPFVEISDGHVTDKNSDNIDGTLYVDEYGQPWMAYVCEWTTSYMGEGRMAVAKLSSDLTRFITEPQEIFYAREAPWTTGGVTDGPWLYKTSEGKLLMIWSSGSEHGYCVGIAESMNGKIDGKWKQQFSRLYTGIHYEQPYEDYEGGHGTIFKTYDGRLMMSIHSPNYSNNEKGVFETAKFIELEDTGDSLKVKELSPLADLLEKITTFFRMFDNWGCRIEYQIRKLIDGIE